jgi:protein ImuB
MFAALVLPDFALQAALRHTPELRERPVVLLAEKTARSPVLQATPAARAAGVVPGFSASQARARCPEVRIKLRSAEAERAADAALLETAFAASPFVENTAPGICTIELKGDRLPDTHALSAMLRVRLAALDLDARIGCAPTADLALLAAQSAQDFREIHSASELSDLPIAHLDPSPMLLEILGKWGIHTLGDFTALNRAALVERLGTEALPLHARATGRIDRPLRCVPPPEIFEESIEFEHEIETLEPLLFMLRRFLEQLALRLETVYLVVAELRLQLGFAISDAASNPKVAKEAAYGTKSGRRTGEPSGGNPKSEIRNLKLYERLFKVPSPTRDVEVLFRMLHTHLESFTAAHPIVRLQLTATPAHAAQQQFGLFESALRDPNQFYETLARLSALVGHDRVGVPVLEPTHRPEAFRLVPADFTSTPRAADVAAIPLGLALHRFRPPLPANVQVEQRPLFLHTTKLRGPIIAAHGPMLLSGDWWGGQSWSRCEWDVQLEGGPLCRIYEQEGAWFLEGIYD